MLQIINTNYHNPERYCETYKKARPFPHIVFKNFFNEELLKLVLEEFPDLKNIDKTIQFHNIYEKKLATNSELLFKENTKKLIYFLNSSNSLSWDRLEIPVIFFLINFKIFKSCFLFE